MRKLILIFVGWLSFSYGLLGQDKKVGAFILVSQEGEVSYLGANDSPAKAVGIGKPIPLSHTIITGKNGKLVGLLSNGTLLTLEEETRMKVGTFKQEPFVAEGKKLTDLPGEPSTSQVLLDLDFGSLIVKTKKLNKGSVFDINSPVGVAGIRGTEFQMASRPGRGVQLDVTESTVAFTPPGGVPMPVTQGNGLSVSPTGVPKLRPVNPMVARKIETTNQTATEATQEVSLGEVVVAMDQSAQEVESMEESPSQEREPDEQTKEDQGTEETDAEVETKESSSQDEQPVEESTPVEDGESTIESSATEEAPPVEEPPAEIPEEMEAVSSEPSGETSAPAEAEAVEELPPLPAEPDVLNEINSQDDLKAIQEKMEESESSLLKIFEEEEAVSPLEPQKKKRADEDSFGIIPKQEEAEGFVPEDALVLSPQSTGSNSMQDDALLEPLPTEFATPSSNSRESAPEPRMPKAIASTSSVEKSAGSLDASSASSPAKPNQANVTANPKPTVNPETPVNPPTVSKPVTPPTSTSNLPDVSRMVQESDPAITQERELKKHQLNDSQKAQFDVLTQTTKAMVKELETPVVQRLTTLEDVGEKETVAFLNLSEPARELVLGLEDSVMTALLQQEIDEELLVESLTKMNMSFPTPKDVPNFQPDFPVNNKLQELSDKLRENGNSWVMDQIFELSEGELTEEWIEKGELALQLLEDYRLDEITPVQAISAQKALSNPFYLDISSLFKELALDELVSGEGTLLGGHNLIISENVHAMQPYFGDTVDEVILSATEDITIQANFEWEAPLETSNARLVLMSGNDLNVAEGVTLRSATSDLVIASWNQLSLRDVELDGAREVSLRGMRDVSLDNVHIGASTLAKIKARRDLDVNGLSFRQDISKIVMEATTLRLRNVSFPASAQVRLNSSLGGVDGRYPNFGKVSAAQQIGRVNFIENVKSGSNLLNNRAAFDQHGANIQIGRITNP
jgi:hypothetical protein